MNVFIELYLNNNLFGFNFVLDKEGKIFRNLIILRFLELKENRIVNLFKVVFVNFYNLEYLDLSDNILMVIEFNIENMRLLIYLDLLFN